jgi:large subunit ribosomal protein L29
MAKSNPAFDLLVTMDAVRLARELEDAHRQMFTLRLQIATRQLSNVKQVNATRRKIARIKTLMRQRELVAAGGEA